MYVCVYAPDSAPGSALEAILVDFAAGFSPLVEKSSSTTVTIDVSGTESLFGPHELLAREIFDRAQILGLTVSVAIADNPDAAILIARYNKEDGRGNRGVIVVPPDKQRVVLSPLPLEALDPLLVAIDPHRVAEIVETLHLWGLETLGDFAALPEKGVGETLGQPGLKLQKLARGTNRRTLQYVIPKREFRQSMDLEAPIELVEQLSFVVSGLVHQLCRQLGGYGLAMIEIRLEAKLDDKSIYSRKLRLPFPMASPHWLSRLLIMDVESCPPASAIQSVTIEAEPVKPRPLQKGLFEPLTPEPEKLELTLARLARLVGVDNVGAPEVLNTHRPDAFRLKSFVLSKKPATFNFSTPQTHSLLSLRMFRPPLPVEVKVAQVAQTVSLRPPESRANSLFERQHLWGDQSMPPSQDSVRNLPNSKLTGCSTEEPIRPIHLKSSQKQMAAASGRIVRESGPWRTSGNWWSGSDNWTREEWDVALSNGALYRIFRDICTGGWFVEGVYD